jgi:hypothetical protein
VAAGREKPIFEEIGAERMNGSRFGPEAGGLCRETRAREIVAGIFNREIDGATLIGVGRSLQPRTPTPMARGVLGRSGGRTNG